MEDFVILLYFYSYLTLICSNYILLLIKNFTEINNWLCQSVKKRTQINMVMINRKTAIAGDSVADIHITNSKAAKSMAMPFE